jgi:type II secretory pathway predicted ATPase ExeA
MTAYGSLRGRVTSALYLLIQKSIASLGKRCTIVDLLVPDRRAKEFEARAKSTRQDFDRSLMFVSASVSIEGGKMEYYQYFRLEGSPFQPASPHGAVYFGSTQLEGLATLEAGLLNDLSGLTMLTGEAGTGKTTLIYSFLQRDYQQVRIAYVSDPKLSFLGIMQVVMEQLNLQAHGTTKLDYLNVLDRFLDLHGKEERIAIVVDDSQALSDDVLEELRLLSNRGQRRDRCLQLILVSQPELVERLKKPEFRQLNQRISTRGVLKPLSTAEALSYLECKLMAQNSKSSSIFESRALNILLRASEGIPRNVNTLCENAMMAALYALERKVGVGTAKKVVEEYRDSVAGTELKHLSATGWGSIWPLRFRRMRHWNQTFNRRSGQIPYSTTQPSSAELSNRRRDHS